MRRSTDKERACSRLTVRAASSVHVKKPLVAPDASSAIPADARHGARESRFTVAGTHAERTTQSSLMVWNVAQTTMQGTGNCKNHMARTATPRRLRHRSIIGYGVAPYSNATLGLRYKSKPQAKFKIRTVASCKECS